jgi:hypothetical protein
MVKMIKKVSTTLILLCLFSTAFSFGEHFVVIGMIINESEENIYCISHIKKDVKEILDFKEWASKENQKFYGGIVPFYWNDKYIVDMKGAGAWEHTKKIILNTSTWINTTAIPNELILFQADFPMKKDSPMPPDEGVTNYYLKLIQLLDYFFSEIILYDSEGNIFLTLEDLRGYYDGLEDAEIRMSCPR